MNEKYSEIINKYGNRIKINEDVFKYHTFRIHGNAEAVLLPENIEEFKDMICICKKNNYKYSIIGNGSNILFEDGNYHGVLITTRKLNNIIIDEFSMYCECGASVPSAAFKALNAELKGLEYLSGIPGTIGGAIVMNAGAYGSEIKDIIEYVSLCDLEGNVYKLTPEELEMSYRHSDVKKRGLIVLSCNLKLEKGCYDEIKEIMDSCKNKRLKSQPLEYPSAGSMFKKGEDYFAGQLIDELGLKGYSIGGAQVSEKHANFIINKNEATTADVENLIKYIQKNVSEKYNVDLKTEVEFL